MGVFKDGVDLEGGGAEIIVNLGLHLHWTHDVLLYARLDFPLQSLEFGGEGEFTAECVLLEEVGEFAFLVHQDNSACLSFDFRVVSAHFLEHGGLLALSQSVAHSKLTDYN